VYVYRFSELVKVNETQSSITNNTVTVTGFESAIELSQDKALINLAILCLYGLTLVFITLYSTIRIAYSFRKRSITFGLIVIFKGLLLILNILASAFFLYEALVPREYLLFRPVFYISVVLCVVVPSCIVTLLSNSFVSLISINY
jgi:hypothetical protein